MKILLDIDGVMIPARPWQPYEIGVDGFGMFNKIAVECLNKVLKESIEPEIILTTSHKHNFNLDKWLEIFNSRGVLITEINRLSTDSLKLNRKEEIEAWYLKNQNVPFIVIDDDKRLNAFDLDFKDDYLILTNATIGLNIISTEEAIKKINHLQEKFFSNPI